MNNLSIKISEYIDYFKKNTNYPNILGKIFNTDLCSYYYDTGTNKVLSCNKVECKVIEKILNKKIETIKELEEEVDKEDLIEALSNIKYAIDRDDILKVGGDLKFTSLGHYEELDKELDSNVNQLVLELTGKCNLRCSYCIYSESYEGKRNFNDKEMTEEIAFKAIDYLNLHGDKEEVAVTFYGGEPLIKFDLLKKCIQYSQDTIKDKKVSFSLTSNLTLMTKEIAEYLASVDGLSITCSIDGPKEIHDSSRVDINGNGSFDRAIRGLRYVVDAFGEKTKDVVGLSMVFDEPFYIEKIDKIHSFFEGLEWLPKEVRKNVTYPSRSHSNYDEVALAIKEEDEDRKQNPIVYWSEEEYYKRLKHSDSKEFFTKSVIESSFLKIHKRPIFIKAIKDINLNACCVPGARKIYVTTDGNFAICEKIDGSPIIGNVYDGIDKKTIKELLVDKYAEESIKRCKNCWASRLCGLCYAMTFKNRKMDMKKKDFHCISTRKHIKRSLTFYHKCLEANPKQLEYLNEISVR